MSPGFVSGFGHLSNERLIAMQIRVSTLITVVLVIAALALAAIGFMSATDSGTPPAWVVTFMLISAALFGVLAVQGLRRREMWQRFLGVAAVVAAIYMAIMAILSFQMLNAMLPPPY